MFPSEYFLHKIYMFYRNRFPDLQFSPLYSKSATVPEIRSSPLVWHGNLEFSGEKKKMKSKSPVWMMFVLYTILISFVCDFVFSGC